MCAYQHADYSHLTSLPNSLPIAPITEEPSLKEPIRSNSPILYSTHRSVQHPHLMFYQPALPTKDAAIAIESSFHKRCNIYFNVAGVGLSVALSVFLATLCITCTIISLPLMMTSGIGFFAALLAEAIAAFSGIAAYAINQRLSAD